MSFKGNHINTGLFVAGIILGVIGSNWVHTMNKGMNEPTGRDANDVRIEQHAKCKEAGMGSRLDMDDKLVCTPNAGVTLIAEFWDKKRAEYLISKENKAAVVVKEPFWPENPDSFETLSKRTE